MDKNVILAVFLLFSILAADVSNAKFRYLAAVDPKDNSAATQGSGANKPAEAGKKEPDAVDSPSQLDTKELKNRDLVSPPQLNEITDNSKSPNTTDLVNPTVQNKAIDSPNGSNNTDDAKNSKGSDEKDSALSHPDKEKNMNNTSHTVLSPQVNGTKGTNHEKNEGTDNEKKDETDSGKNNETDSGKKDEADSGKKGTDSGKDGTDSRKEGINSGKNEETDNRKAHDNGKDGTDSAKEATGSGKKGRTDSGKQAADGGKKDGTDSNKKDKTKEDNNEDERDSEAEVDETCMGLPNRCTSNGLIACIQRFDTEAGTRNWTVLVQNQGEKPLTVNFTVLPAAENSLKKLEISKHKTKKIIISSAAGKGNKVIFYTGLGKCVLHMSSNKSEEKSFVYLPSYDNLLTPINGAYFMILSVLIFGGTWACCKLRKRRWHDGVPYQELEMGLPKSFSTTAVETAEGWDEGWDDNWDDNNAVRSPGSPHMGNISANGLTSRSTTKDGWENDWDD